MTIASGKLGDAGLSVLRDKVAAMNKRAARLGLEPLVLTVVETELVKRTNRSGLSTTVCISSVELSGKAPRINGWEVAARVEFTDAGNLVHIAPHIDNLDNRYRTIGNICEHCNTKRRRNDIVVIRHSDGRELCVGRNCLADYIRSEDAQGLIEYAGWLGSVERMVSDCEEEYRGQRVVEAETPVTLVRAASICVRKLGWVSGSAAYDRNVSSTKDDVCALLYPPPAGSRAYKDYEKWVDECELTVSDYDKDLADKAIEWVKSLSPAQLEKSDYLYNLSVLVRSEMVVRKNYGYVVSLVSTYLRDQERELERKERAEKAAAKGEKVFFGTAKKRERAVRATCKALKSFEGNYGVTTLVRFEHTVSDNEYAILVWFASGDKTEVFEVGEDYTFDATVKDHNDHETYGKQTRINRVTVKS